MARKVIPEHVIWTCDICKREHGANNMFRIVVYEASPSSKMAKDGYQFKHKDIFGMCMLNLMKFAEDLAETILNNDVERTESELKMKGLMEC